MAAESVRFFFVVLIAAASALTVDPFPDNECTRPGFLCDNCTTSYLCYQRPDETWAKEFFEDCTLTNQTCRESTGACTREVNEPCAPRPPVDFKCRDVGTFPDPYDCSRYHVCVRSGGPATLPLERITGECEPGVWFDAMQLRCMTEARGECVQPVANCTRVSHGPVVGSPTMYHECVRTVEPSGLIVYVPEIAACPGTRRYLRGDCVDPAQPLGIVDGKCTMLGYLYVPTNATGCGWYNDCRAIGDEPMPRRCDYFFNPTTEKCDMFSCKHL